MEFLEPFTTIGGWISLLSLSAMEIVLGVDNLVFVALSTQGLPAPQRAKAARLGLALAIFFRLALLSSMFMLAHLSVPLFTAMGHQFTGRDLVLALGGLFLLYKGTQEIHEEIAPDDPAAPAAPQARGFFKAIVQIALLDIVFSLDSVLTAIGMADHLVIMVAAVVIAILLMMVAAAPLSRFIGENPSVKMLALSFLLLIGMSLLTESFGYHVPKGFIYAAIGFSVLVEGLNQFAGRARRKAARLKPPPRPDSPDKFK
ncbi:Membrane protein TerC, possibly involved in tellurium resistance [Rhodoblastus acidophilus]|uniref:Membrane protein TerC, possibly involved in tellurium resistance n=1 Tax=Rhodoblastus acidophilus TaxID=1074 RepID=A0A212RXF4_RHOAC|nr:TerC family protein [Rhodoblastus acidophilus]SNB77282.1 Membrane protein TerC, possibly involved in tellurium resistance [Rhodoblastus acidophilus]